MAEHSRRRGRLPMTWVRAAAWSAIATAAAMGLMFLARAAFQIRTLPERLMEWLLLFIPLDQFERGIEQFGPRAKEFALTGAVVGMALLLFAPGTLALRRRLPGPAILAMAFVLYLVAMAGIMPLTGGGLFGTALFQHPLLVNGSYLGIALAYGTLLLAGRTLGPSPAIVEPAR